MVIRRYNFDEFENAMVENSYGDYVLYLTHRKAIEELREEYKKSYEVVPTDMREHAENIFYEVFNDRSGDLNREISNRIQSYLEQHFVAFEGKENLKPYFGWCDVDGCEKEACGGGNYWRETGYWKICSEHGAQCRNGVQQPKMKSESVARENSRLPNGFLP